MGATSCFLVSVKQKHLLRTLGILQYSFSFKTPNHIYMIQYFKSGD